METILKANYKPIIEEIPDKVISEILKFDGEYEVIEIDEKYYYAQKVYYTLILGLIKMFNISEEERKEKLRMKMMIAGRYSNPLFNALNIIYKNQYCIGSKYTNNTDNLVYIINEYCRKYYQPNILDFCFLPLSNNVLISNLIIGENVFNGLLERKLKKSQKNVVTAQTPSSVVTAQTPSSVVTAQTPSSVVTAQTPSSVVTAVTIGVQERFILVDFKTLYDKLGIINPNDPNYESLLNEQKPIGLPIFFSFLYGCGFRLSDESQMSDENVKNTLTLYLTVDKVTDGFISIIDSYFGDSVKSVFNRFNYSNVFGNYVYKDFFTEGLCNYLIGGVTKNFDINKVNDNRRVFIRKSGNITPENVADRINIFTFFYDLFINNRYDKRGGNKTKRRRRSGLTRRKLRRTNNKRRRSIRRLKL
jgi:hypothetical protein